MDLNSAPQPLPTLPQAPVLPEVEEELDLQQQGGEMDELNAESVVEAAELLLREGAPHDFDVVIIGAGPGGLACATHLAQNGQNVALIEREEVGGVCLNRGCIPTKTLTESVRVLRLMRRAQNFGIGFTGEIQPDLRQMQTRKREVVADLRARSEMLAEEMGVKILRGTARLLGESAVELEGADGVNRRLSAIHIVIATGGVPAKLPVPGAELEGVLTSDQILELEEVPRHLIVLGGGAVGVEFASIFAALGTHTTLIEKARAVLPGEDEDIQNEMKRSLQDWGIEVFVSTSVERIEEISEAERMSKGLRVVYQTADGELHIEAELVLMAVERKPNIEGLGLEKAGIETRGSVIPVEDDNSTTATGVWAIGDCIRRIGWAHQAALEGRRVADAILGIESQLDARFIPTCYYTFPEVATVGMTFRDAQKAGLEARVGRSTFRHNGRAKVCGDTDGFVKLVVETGSGKILGAQIIGPHATELINKIAVTLRNGDTAEMLASVFYTHPTFAEVLSAAASNALK